MATRDDVEAMMHDLAAGKTVGRKKTKPRGRRQRRLTDDEHRQLATALDTAKVWKPVIAATWLLILTGWRRGEVLGLRWSDVDLAR